MTRAPLPPGADALFAHIYGDAGRAAARERWDALSRAFTERFRRADARFFSAPGRSELGGNHTDHNGGKAIACAVSRDCAVCAAPAPRLCRVHDLAYGEDFCLEAVPSAPVPGESGAKALVRGILTGFAEAGFALGGFDACVASDIAPGSGVSSSAAFENAVCAALNGLYNGGALPPERLARIGQAAENAYWGKASGMLDQLTSAAGGLCVIDFGCPGAPELERIPSPFEAARTRMLLVDTGSGHEALSAEYSAIPAEMRAAARLCGRETLRGVTAEEVLARAPDIRASCGDRALLRAFHFIEENRRADAQAAALKRGDVRAFLALARDSGASSWKWLQNVSAPSPRGREQSAAVCLALTELFIAGRGLREDAACRIHGGGFAGVIQVFLPEAAEADYTAWMRAALGKQAGENPVSAVRPRPLGALEIR